MSLGQVHRGRLKGLSLALTDFTRHRRIDRLLRPPLGPIGYFSDRRDVAARRNLDRLVGDDLRVCASFRIVRVRSCKRSLVTSAQLDAALRPAARITRLARNKALARDAT